MFLEFKIVLALGNSLFYRTALLGIKRFLVSAPVKGRRAKITGKILRKIFLYSI